MATLMARANGNWNTSTTWAVCAEYPGLNGTTELTDSYQDGVSFATDPGEVDGIAVYVSSRASSPTGTISVALYNATLAEQVSGSEVTINVADLGKTFTDQPGGWTFLKFASPISLAAETDYQVRAKTSEASGQVTLFTDTTTADWSYYVRTTGTAAIAEGYTVVIAGEKTSAGNQTTRTVTMDDTVGTLVGDVLIGSGGTLSWGTSASTDYLLLTGTIYVFSGGTYNMGTTGTPVPSTSTATLQLGGDLIAYGEATISIQGTSITYDRCLLSADAVATDSTLTTDVETGWKDGDIIGIASTSQTYSENETFELDGDASGTTLTIDGALTYDHSGTTPTKAEIINLTRNVKIEPGMS